MLSSVNPLMGNYTAMRQNAAQHKNQIGGDSFAAAAENVAEKNNTHVRLPGENERYSSGDSKDQELVTDHEKFEAGKTDERAVYGTEQVDALLDSAGYARVTDMDAATLYDKLSDTSRNVLARIETGRKDITREEWTAFCKELRDLGAITDKGFNSARADHKLIPLGHDFKSGGRFSYGSPPGMKDKLKSLYESGLSGKHFGITTTDDWTGDPIAYFDAWFKTMQKWRDDLATQKNPDGTPKYDSFAPIDDHIGAWAEVSALLNDLMNR